jgi:ATP-dependent helicase/nuclease subunit A
MKTLDDQKTRDFITGVNPKHLDYPVFAIAGAGAGKTHSIKKRVLNLVLKKDLCLKNLVIITYTTKAAQEIQARIRGVLEEALVKEPKEEFQKKIRKALTELPLAKISTVHSFCRDLLLSYPVEFLVDPKAEILDDVASSIFHLNIKNKFIEHFMNKSNFYFKNKIAFDSYEFLDEKVFDAFEKLYKNRDLKPKQVHQSFPNLSIDESNLWGSISSLINDLNDIDKYIKDRSDNLYQLTPFYLSYFFKLKSIDDLFSIEYKEGTFLHKNAGSEKNYNDKKWLKNLKAQIKFIREEFDRLTEIRLIQKYQHLINSYEVYELLANEDKIKNGFIDFFDCLMKVKVVLDMNQSLCSTISQDIHAFIIDESQDSDPLQFEIIKLLVSDNPKKLFLVGDGQQSIYSFARASKEVFDDLCVEVSKKFNGKIKNLTTNFRSNKDILNFINHSFSEIFDDYTPMALDPKKSSKNGKVESIDLISNLNDEPIENLSKKGVLKVELKRDREAFLVAKKIQNMIMNFGYHPHDFLILFRSSTSMDVYENAFQKMNLKVNNTKSSDYLKKSESIEILNLLGFIIFNENPFYLKSVEEASFYQNDKMDEIKSILQSKGNYENKAREILKVFGLFSFTLGTQDSSYLESFEYIVQKLNLEASLEKGNIQLAFLNMLERSKDDNFSYQTNRDEKVYYQKLNNDSITLMTIHAAKGLEAKCVFLVAHDNEAPETKQFVDQHSKEIFVKNPYLNKKIAEEHQIKSVVTLIDKIESEKNLEEKRVLYVALTRAESEIYVTKSSGNDQSEFLTPILPFLNKYPVRVLDINNFSSDYEFFKNSNPEKTFKKIDNSFNPSGISKIFNPRKLNQSVTQKIENKHLFKTSKRISRGVDFGTFAHKVMEIICYHLSQKIDFSVKQIIDQVILLDDFDIKKNDAQDLEIAIQKFLKNPLAEKIRNAQSIGGEVPFSIPDELHGIIDLLIEEFPGVYLVVDFKTDVLTGNDHEQEIRLHYKQQVDLYADSLRQMGLEIKDRICFYLFDR